MTRFERVLGILLALRSGRTVSAAALARRFEVSTRTIYRDVETLSSLGVPVYAEMGRSGGFRLMEGYFLPPVMFSQGEALALLLGVTLLRSLRAVPFSAELDTGEQKLLAAMPANLRSILAEARKVIGFEAVPADAFSLELSQAAPPGETVAPGEGSTVAIFLQAVLDRRTVALRYRSPYRGKTQSETVVPLGLFWDRDRWYLVGPRIEAPGEPRLWRADRVLEIAPRTVAAPSRPDFDVRDLLGRAWLRDAMADWTRESPVVIRLTGDQASRLQQDWYYGHAAYAAQPDGAVRMTFGEDNQELVLALLRWLGPGAELLDPTAWRAAARAELTAMLACYAEDAP